MGHSNLITVSVAAERIGIAPAMLYKKAYRLQIGLRSVPNRSAAPCSTPGHRRGGRWGL